MQHVFDQIPWSTVNWDSAVRQVIDIGLLMYALWIAHPIIRKILQQPMWPWAGKTLAFLFCLATLIIVVDHQMLFIAHWINQSMC